jgi:hypothetical protein
MTSLAVFAEYAQEFVPVAAKTISRRSKSQDGRSVDGDNALNRKPFADEQTAISARRPRQLTAM